MSFDWSGDSARAFKVSEIGVLGSWAVNKLGLAHQKFGRDPANTNRNQEVDVQIQLNSIHAQHPLGNLSTLPSDENMADRGGGAPRGGGGFGGRGDRGRGDRGRGGRGGRRGRRGGKSDEKEWQPVTKLGRLVKAGKIKSMEEIYLHSLPIKEFQIVDFFLPKLKDEVMKVRTTLPSGF